MAAASQPAAGAVAPEILEGHLKHLLNDLYDLQFPAAFRLLEEPSSLEALRMVSKSHPTVIVGFNPIRPEAADRDWHAPETYVDIHKNGPVTIAVTDDGFADSVRDLPDGQTAFVKPLEDEMPMGDFLDRLLLSNGPSAREIFYLQSQDGNIYRSEPGMRPEPELASFQSAIKQDIPWMSEAVGGVAEAVNLWIGTSRSVTSFHHDPYENIYHVLTGSKTFTLLSPIDGLWLDQRFHQPATLLRNMQGSLVPERDPESAPAVPWVQNPFLPGDVRPIIVTVEEGETLYLPAGWWHKVEQEEGEKGLCVAVNYWYPSELKPQRYAFERFAQRVARTAGREGVIPIEDDSDGDDGRDAIDEDVFASDSGEEWEPSEWGR